MKGFFTRLIQKISPRTIAARINSKADKDKAQLEYLARLLNGDFNNMVSYQYEPRGAVHVFRTKKEIIACVTFHPCGVMHQSTDILVRMNRKTLTAWFQLAFLGMRLNIMPLEETLRLTYQKPRER